MRRIRRAFWLCEIEDQYHGALFVFGGLTTFKNLVSLHNSKWKALGDKALRWPCKVPLNQFQIKKLLSVIALWSVVKIVLGPLIDVSLLSRDEVSDITNREICDDDGDEEVLIPSLNKIKESPAYEKKMMAYLDNTITKDNLRLSYVVHSGLPPSTFSSLSEEKHWLVPIDDSTAAYKRDNKLIYNAMTRSIKDPTAKPWLDANDHCKIKNGQGVFLQVKRIGDGNDNSEMNSKQLQQQLNAVKYQGMGSCNAKKATTRLINLYQKLSDEGITYTGLEKLRHLKNNFNIADEKMWHDYWVSDW